MAKFKNTNIQTKKWLSIKKMPQFAPKSNRNLSIWRVFLNVVKKLSLSLLSQNLFLEKKSFKKQKVAKKSSWEELLMQENTHKKYHQILLIIIVNFDEFFSCHWPLYIYHILHTLRTLSIWRVFSIKKNQKNYSKILLKTNVIKKKNQNINDSRYKNKNKKKM